MADRADDSKSTKRIRDADDFTCCCALCRTAAGRPAGIVDPPAEGREGGQMEKNEGQFLFLSIGRAFVCPRPTDHGSGSGHGDQDV